ncbi:BON1-associated protein 2-like [Cryptomeria japonica]|uniref:BON1-associated protein 2-like n=1 Tax=Cryptomeria japonica TaxID=3369 RepID=UPI0027D9F836|nr:BON1-associated protein 2-like [Cryptomeria japonica]
MRTYANVWSDPTNRNSTRVDRHGGSYPTWNDKFHMDVSKCFLQQKGSTLLIQIYTKTLLGKKRVGSARVPYADILEGFTKPDSIHFLSYRIRSRNGRPRGTLDLSLRFLDKIDQSLGPSRPQSEIKFPSFPSRSRINASSNGECNNGAVNSFAIGIPISQISYARPSQIFPHNSMYSESHNNCNGYYK